MKMAGEAGRDGRRLPAVEEMNAKMMMNRFDGGMDRHTRREG